MNSYSMEAGGDILSFELHVLFYYIGLLHDLHLAIAEAYSSNNTSLLALVDDNGKVYSTINSLAVGGMISGI